MWLLLFDIDQTLITTGGAGIRALDRAFEKLFSIKNSMAGIVPHGKTDPGIIREIFIGQGKLAPDGNFRASLEPILGAYLEFLREEIDTTSAYHILPGISELLNYLLTRDDILLGLATGNVETGARIKLGRGNLNRYFSFGGFGSDSENRTELVSQGVERGQKQAFARWGQKLSPSHIFVIGDTPRDIDAGREAGFQTVGVATGKYSAAELAEAGATLSIADFVQGRDQFFRATCIA